MIVGVAGILLLSGPVGTDGAAAGTRGERSGRRGSERARERECCGECVSGEGLALPAGPWPSVVRATIVIILQF